MCHTNGDIVLEWRLSGNILPNTITDDLPLGDCHLEEYAFTRAPVVYAGGYNGTLVAVYGYNGGPCVCEG